MLHVYVCEFLSFKLVVSRFPVSPRFAGMTWRERLTNSVILKEPKRVFRIYLQRVVMLVVWIELSVIVEPSPPVWTRSAGGCAYTPLQNQKSQQLVPAGKVFGLLGFFVFISCYSSLSRCPDWFSGEENTAPCTLCSRNWRLTLLTD